MRRKKKWKQELSFSMANIFLSQSQHKQILRFMFMQLNNYGFIIKWQLLQSDRRKTVFTAWSQLCKIFYCWICEFQVFFICRSIGFSFSPRLLFVYFSFFLFLCRSDKYVWCSLSISYSTDFSSKKFSHLKQFTRIWMYTALLHNSNLIIHQLWGSQRN